MNTTFTGNYCPMNSTLYFPPKRVLITGSRGLIGSAICTHLRTKGWEVTGYDIKDVYASPESIIQFYDVVIDCARYDNPSDQRTVWNAVIQKFKARGKGRLILFSSIYGHKAPDFEIYIGTDIRETPLEYAIWKGGTEQAVRWLAQKLKPYHIQVNAIAPGGVLDGHSEIFQTGYITSGGISMIGVRNIMPVIDALLHDDNAINGQIITVDGGWSL